MCLKLFFIHLFCSLLFFNIVKSQEVSGNWYGVGKLQKQSTSDSYLAELVMNQKGKKITGMFKYYFRDSLFSNTITGTFNSATRSLVIHQLPVIFYQSASTKYGVDCMMTGDFILRISRTESILVGNLMGTDQFKYTCPPIQFKLKKMVENIVEVADQVSTQSSSALVLTQSDTVAIHQKINIPINVSDQQKQSHFSKRTKSYIKEIEVCNNNLKLEFYDNGAIDNDSISVFFNNNLIVPKVKLDVTPLRMNIQLDESLPSNEISMFAENLGKIPPNTALLVIYDGVKRTDLLLTSDFLKNATIRLINKRH